MSGDAGDERGATAQPPRAPSGDEAEGLDGLVDHDEQGAEERPQSTRESLRKLGERFQRLANTVGALQGSLAELREEQQVTETKLERAVSRMQARLEQLKEARQVQAETQARVEETRRVLLSTCPPPAAEPVQSAGCEDESKAERSGSDDREELPPRDTLH
jgi:DNA repair exonuclease SbcCD ATPase subunit